MPMLLNDNTQYNSEIKQSNIPEKPEHEFSSRIIPIEEYISEPEPVPPDAGNDPVQAPVDEPAETVLEEPESKAVDTAVSSARNTPVPDLKDKEVGVKAWIVQLGSFSSESNAQKLNENLRKQGFTAFVEPLQQKSRIIYRVRVGPELLRSDAEDIRDKIRKSMQMDGIVIPYP